MATLKTSSFDFLDSINESKLDIMTSDNEDAYQPYVINRFLSGTLDTIFYANEMNTRFNLDKKLQYDYLRNSVRQRRRRAKWLKTEQFEHVDIIKKFYKCNTNRAMEVLSMLTDKDINELKESLDTGGINN